MSKISILLLAIVLFPGASFGQYFEFGIVLGGGVMQVGELSHATTVEGETIPSTFQQFGAIVQVSPNDYLLLGGSISRLVNKQYAGRGTLARLGGFEYNIILGWIVSHWMGAEFYPYFHLGGAKTSLQFFGGGEGNDFGDIVADPSQMADISTSDLVLGLGLGGEWRWDLNPGSGKARGIALGFRVGFRTTVGGPNWEMVGYTLSSDVAGIFKGPYALLSLSFFTTMSENAKSKTTG